MTNDGEQGDRTPSSAGERGILSGGSDFWPTPGQAARERRHPPPKCFVFAFGRLDPGHRRISRGRGRGRGWSWGWSWRGRP